MGQVRPPPGVSGPTLDIQVLEGLETYIATEQFLHKLEAASAEWIDLSEHRHQQAGAGGHEHHAPELELPEVGSWAEAPSDPAAPASQQAGADQPAPARSSSSNSGSGGGFFSRWRRSAPSPGGAGAAAASDAAEQPAPSGTPAEDGQAAAAAGASSSSSSASSSDAAEALSSDGAGLPPVVVATTCFEVVGPQPHLAASLMQEPFVLVSSEDAIEGMAYYIALYLSRAPEARHMEPRQLQAALRQTFTDIRRSRYRAIWDWGRWLYRWGAVSYSALQLYEHPWVVRAVVAGVWASSRMALGFLW